MRRKLGVLLTLVLFGAGVAMASAQSTAAKQIIDATGIKGGLVVHLGCGDGKLTAALRANRSYVVHGFDADPANVEKARANVRELGAYGPVAVDHFDGSHLPYIDNVANLIVAEDSGGVSQDELMRVLCLNSGRAPAVRSGGAPKGKVRKTLDSTASTR
jgi:SAM-dependent methyltransferase